MATKKYVYLFTKLGYFLLKLGPFLAGVRPNGSAEPSVKLAGPFGFGRTTFLGVRSFTKWKKCENAHT